MKLLFIKAIFLASVMGACGVEEDIAAKNVPSVVINTFNLEFDEPGDVEWEKIKDNYHAEFNVEAVDYEAIINSQGDLIMAKNDMPVADLPKTIRDKIRAKYSNGTIDEVERLTKGKEVFYQVEFDGTPAALIFTAQGEETDSVEFWD